MNTNISASQGHGFTLGASREGENTNFAIYSSTAKKIELCLYDQNGDNEIARFAMHQGEQAIWHIELSGIGDHQIYSYYVYGDYLPEQGVWHDPTQPLLDPYARKIHGQFCWSRGILEEDEEKYWLKPTPPKAEVSHIDKYQGVRPNIPWHKMFIYECHVKGTTQLFPDIKNSVRGKFLGLADPSFIKHLKNLGITAIELLPSQYFISEEFIVNKGLSNYWGYNTLNFFAPHPDYLVADDVREFQQMVAAFHQAGIEVILDVVYNHTAEGNNLGPTLSFRGIDNSYYRVHKEKPSEYINDTGCGNTVDITTPATLRLVMDSLRYWVEYMGVDGFRFDLATILGRKYAGYRTNLAFFQTINQDPVLSRAKMIAEPWDIGPGGYQLGAFAAPWREWNDQYRDAVRQFWRGDNFQLPVFAKHFHGSGYLFEGNNRPVSSGINFITAHDGFTLNDLVSYQDKHNYANGENNRDGHSDNLSHNWGVEGETDDNAINALRLTMQKNLLLSLALSQGVPMICAGSEVAHSQSGNNNAYCQDNKIGWIDWQKDGQAPEQHPLYQFIQTVFSLRKEMSFFQQEHFIHDDDERFDLQWLNSQANAMSDGDWQQGDNHHLGYLITDKVEKQSMLVLFNASASDLLFSLPSNQKLWQLRIDTSSVEQTEIIFPSACGITVKAHSSCVLSSTEQEIDYE
ncbi:glycogen debranching protein GlgX [Thalassotalea sp. PLHSN55]|uniref:glycogen debranching protein GlgX n=1 Tax=Thalassotalea sp. PLHSN55 TaxID=3435888 RepID=UPI003F875E6A